MRTLAIKSLAVGLASVLLTFVAPAQTTTNVVISGFTPNGVLTVTNVIPYSTCRVEWASSPLGPWTNTWAHLNDIQPGSNTSFSIPVPMFYRVVMVPPPSYTVTWCNFQFPNQIEVQVNTPSTVYGQVYIPGLTDQTPGVDTAPALRAQFGFGPAGTAPSGNNAWSWINATGNAGYSDANNDEYSANAVFTAPGSYDCLFRFSGDSGMTWLYGGLSGASQGTAPVPDAVRATVFP